VRYVRFDPSSNPTMLGSLICCYQGVFAGEPWNEDWPAATIEADLRRELAKPDASCWLAAEGEAVIGFCWGYSLEVGQFDEHLGLVGVDAILCSLGLAKVAYFDEIGVATQWRGHGIAKRLFGLRRADFMRSGLETAVVRTMSNPPTVVYGWYGRDGYRIIAEYNDERKRVVMVNRL